MTVQMNCVLVTGANGFIGRNLCESLYNKSYVIKVAIRDIKGCEQLHPDIEKFIIGDIVATDLNIVLRQIDTVIHLAARVHILKKTVTNSLSEFQRVNVAGTERLAKEAAINGVRRFIYVSSIGVNGSQTKNSPFTEESIPNPYDPYTHSKWEAEQALYKIAQDTGLEIVILRPPLVYGPNAPGNFGRLMRLISRGIFLPLGSIKNKRSFIYLGNLVDAIIKCIEYPNAANQTFLVSDGQDVSTPELIRMIAKAMGKKARLFPCPAPLLKMIGKVAGKSSEVERLTGFLQIDSAKIRKTLNWTPPYTIKEGISKTVLSYKF